MCVGMSLMRSKRKKETSPLESISTHSGDPSENSQEYWERVLSESGLSMNRGRAPQQWIDRGRPNEHREDIVTHVGTSANLVGIEEEETRNRTGRVNPKGHRPE